MPQLDPGRAQHVVHRITLDPGTRFQTIDGSVAVSGRSLRPLQTALRGNELSFALPEAKGIARFSGRVKDNAMEGMVELPGATAPARWSAVRTAAAKVITE